VQGPVLYESPHFFVIDLGGVPFDVATLGYACDWLLTSAFISRRTGLKVRLADAYNVALASNEPDHRELMTEEGMNLPDGTLVLWFMRLRSGKQRQLKSLLEPQGTGDRPLFEVTDDPGITPIGKFLSEHSRDELPQLIDVLDGSMSLVGPRPQGAGEVALHGEWDGRRLLVKPGIRIQGALASEWPFEPRVGRRDSPRPLLRGELVADGWPYDPVQDGSCSYGS